MDNMNLMEYWLKSSDEDYKETFSQKCTNDYTSKQIKNIEEVRIWLRNLLTEK